MSNFLKLFVGELVRAKKYKILAASLFLPFFWIVILELFAVKDLTEILPLLVYLDVTVMAMLFIGVTIMFEKQEKTLSTLMITPIRRADYFLAKISVNLVSNVGSFTILFLYAKIFREVNINILTILFSIIIISVLHSSLGFIFATRVKDFTNLLVSIMVYSLIFALPVLFEEIGLINNEIIQNLMYMLPTKASLIVIMSSISEVDFGVIFSVIYVILLTIICLYINAKSFDQFIVKESGA